MIRFQNKNLDSWVNDRVLSELQPQVSAAHALLESGKGPGSDFLGWANPAKIISKNELALIKKTAKRVIESSDLMVVVGIGGSYLGARAVLEALPFADEGVDIAFAGFHISARDTEMLLAELDDHEVTVNVISKSGTTTEPAIAFRILKNYMEKRYGKEEAKKRIIATTDKRKGALRQMADQEGYTTFVVPDDVGGRFSVLTAVGLFPIAAAGHDVDALLKGAADAHALYSKTDNVLKNDCYRYAASRASLYRQGKCIEVLSNFEPGLHYIGEWWKQLNGESEGKNRSGIFPAACDFTTDLHSMGQWIQEGQRNVFETFLIEENAPTKIKVPKMGQDLDGLEYLAGKSLSEVNKQAWLGTAAAHLDGGVPNSTILFDEISTKTLGELIYFFERACAISCYMAGVNPFDQPGVEAYKTNMFALLGKPGFEAAGKALRAKLGGK